MGWEVSVGDFGDFVSFRLIRVGVCFGFCWDLRWG